MCVYVIFCAFYEPTIKISVFELIRRAGKRGEGKLIKSKTIDGTHLSLNSFLSVSIIMTVMSNSLTNVTAKHGKDALE